MEQKRKQKIELGLLCQKAKFQLPLSLTMSFFQSFSSLLYFPLLVYPLSLWVVGTLFAPMHMLNVAERMLKVHERSLTHQSSR